jgi:co-chaperonin GroES (HSP10)
MISSAKNIVPLLNKVVIQKIVPKVNNVKELSKTSSGLYIPESTNKQKNLFSAGNFNKAQIISISANLKDKGLTSGDLVLYPASLDHLASVKIEGAQNDIKDKEHVLLVNVEDIVAKVNE